MLTLRYKCPSNPTVDDRKWKTTHHSSTQTKSQESNEQEGMRAKNRRVEKPERVWRSEFLASPSYGQAQILWPFRSHYACRYAYAVSWSVDCNGKIWLVFATVLVLITSGLDSDVFAFVRGKVFFFRDHLPIFLVQSFPNFFILPSLPLLALFRISSSFYPFYPP